MDGAIFQDDSAGGSTLKPANPLPAPPMNRFRRSFRRHAALLACFLAPAAFCLAEPPGAQPIFDGKTLSGWNGNPESWRVEDGAITGEIPDGKSLGRNEFIFWEGTV